MDPAPRLTDDLVERLELEPHPEGGRYRRTFLDPDGAASAILYHLAPGERSRWHRVGAIEIWTFCAGAPMQLRVSAGGGPVETHRLGVDTGAEPQVVVPAGAWQSAAPEGGPSLVSCVVVPAFRWEAFELAPEGWEPGPHGGRL